MNTEDPDYREKLLAASVNAIKKGQDARIVYKDLAKAAGGLSAVDLICDVMTLIEAEAEMQKRTTRGMEKVDLKNGTEGLREDIEKWKADFMKDFSIARMPNDIGAAIEKGFRDGSVFVDPTPEQKQALEQALQASLKDSPAGGVDITEIKELPPPRYHYFGKSEYELTNEELRDAVLKLGNELKYLREKNYILSTDYMNILATGSAKHEH